MSAAACPKTLASSPNMVGFEANGLLMRGLGSSSDMAFESFPEERLLELEDLLSSSLGSEKFGGKGDEEKVEGACVSSIGIEVVEDFQLNTGGVVVCEVGAGSERVGV